VAVVLLISYLLPYISPIKAPSLAVLSLLVPLLFIINLIFLVFWMVRLKKYFLLSAVCILLGFGYISSMYKFSGIDSIQEEDLSLMSYNVKMFNHYHWNDDDSLAKDTYKFITQQQPDILVIQEFFEDADISFQYPYEYIKTKSKTNIFGLAIYSQFPIVNSGSLDLEDSANNIIFADIVKDQDTIRIYNVHLESMRLNPDKENFGEKNSDKLFRRVKSAFQKQGYQTKKLLAHQDAWKGKSIVCGDFNNTAFSWVYKQIAAGRQDAFVEAGQGTGRSFDYKYPLRIDFILPDESFTVNSFETFDVSYSDHFPILARLALD
jgi:endonuclease/exonuclease/phosphatase (EEP) superfamily protein YafD